MGDPVMVPCEGSGAPARPRGGVSLVRSGRCARCRQVVPCSASMRAEPHRRESSDGQLQLTLTGEEVRRG